MLCNAWCLYSVKPILSCLKRPAQIFMRAPTLRHPAELAMMIQNYATIRRMPDPTILGAVPSSALAPFLWLLCVTFALALPIPSLPEERSDDEQCIVAVTGVEASLASGGSTLQLGN